MSYQLMLKNCIKLNFVMKQWNRSLRDIFDTLIFLPILTLKVPALLHSSWIILNFSV